jgi:hypothetical protein
MTWSVSSWHKQKIPWDLPYVNKISDYTFASRSTIMSLSNQKNPSKIGRDFIGTLVYNVNNINSPVTCTIGQKSDRIALPVAADPDIE